MCREGTHYREMTMKQLIAAAALTILGAGALAADPIEGVWQTQPDDGAFAHVKISPCGGAYCGTITHAFDSAGKPIKTKNIGKQIVRSMAPQGGGKYKGKVLRPADGKTYNGKAEVSGNRMMLAGCVAGGLICKKQTWARVK